MQRLHGLSNFLGSPLHQTLDLFKAVAQQRQIIGFDIMEFAPLEGFHAYDFAAALLSYKLMGIVQRTSNLNLGK